MTRSVLSFIYISLRFLLLNEFLFPRRDHTKGTDKQRRAKVSKRSNLGFYQQATSANLRRHIPQRNIPYETSSYCWSPSSPTNPNVLASAIGRDFCPPGSIGSASDDYWGNPNAGANSGTYPGQISTEPDNSHLIFPPGPIGPIPPNSSNSIPTIIDCGNDPRFIRPRSPSLPLPPSTPLIPTSPTHLSNQNHPIIHRLIQTIPLTQVVAYQIQVLAIKPVATLAIRNWRQS